MAGTKRLNAPLLLAIGLSAGSVGGAPALDARPPLHKIAVEVRGPVAMVQVTRALWPAGDPRGAGEVLLDVGLPDRAALVDLEVQDGGRWRATEVVEASHGRDVYIDGVKAQGLTAVSEPFDDTALFRVRAARGPSRGPDGAGTPVMVRYRFSALPDYAEGRYRLRFPGAAERVPAPAEVSVALSGAADVEIAGVRTALPGGAARGNATGKASTRSGWEISWAPRGAAAGDGPPSVDGVVAAASLAPTETALAFAVHGRAGKQVAPPPTVLFLIDRSRSVGLPGLSAERDLARKLLEALPPTTRFDALFFDRGTKRLFPMERPATREAIATLEGEMVPDRLQNGTNLAGALKEAGGILRRETAGFGPRTLLVVLTDGALTEDHDGAALNVALGAVPGLEVAVAAFAVRPADDEPVTPAARLALRTLAGARGGVAREVHANEIDDAVPAALATLAKGGDVAGVRLAGAGQERALADGLAPDEGLAGITRWPARPPRALEVEATVRGQRTRLALRPQIVDASWLRPHLAPAAPTRLLATGGMVALVEPVLRPAPAHETPLKGSLDRTVVRNTLSLAYLPRARACYLNRSGATPALRDLSGRVRLAIDLVRGEVARAAVQSSTLNHPEIEDCLRDGAFAVDVPRALHSDAPVTAVLNLVFRPRTPEKFRLDDAALSDQIDLVIEEMHRSEQETTQNGRDDGRDQVRPQATPPLP